MKEGDVQVDALTDLQRQVVEVIGMTAFVALCRQFGGASLYIPQMESLQKTARDSRIKKDYGAGVGLKALRRKYGLSETHLRRILRDEHLPGQMNLLELEPRASNT